jgi:hypothetical protein
MREAAKTPLSVGNRAPDAWTSAASRQRSSGCEQGRKAAVKRDARSGKNAAERRESRARCLDERSEQATLFRLRAREEGSG